MRGSTCRLASTFQGSSPMAAISSSAEGDRAGKSGRFGDLGEKERKAPAYSRGVRDCYLLFGSSADAFQAARDAVADQTGCAGRRPANELFPECLVMRKYFRRIPSDSWNALSNFATAVFCNLSKS